MLKVNVIGTRGIPNIQGGVETHCEGLYPLLCRQDVNVELIRRSAYVTDSNNVDEYQGVKIKTIFSPKSKSFEAIVHSFLAVCNSAFTRPDILHIHSIGPCLVTPLAKIFGLKVIMTHHGPDYLREKWSLPAKLFLRMGEWCGVRFANKVIVISEEIGNHIERKYGRKDYIVIPNGVPIAEKSKNTDFIEQFGLIPGKYIFALGRFVPEKGFDSLIAAYSKSLASTSYKLVIAGSADHDTPYSFKLKHQAKKNGIILTGFVKGESLKQLFSHAGLFVIPSTYEGLPIALLEAMSYGLDIIASDIKANTQVNLPEDCYFEVGNIDALSKMIDKKCLSKRFPVNYNMSNYRWEDIAKRTYSVYQELTN